jgi:hypothetical protein
MICFDGTCNHPRDAKQEREWFGLGDIEDNGITNVLKLHVLFGGDLANTANTAKQHSLYYSGVGTYGNRFQQVFNAAFSPDNLDVRRIIRTAGEDLKPLYRKEDGDRIFIFGFSRGAAIARRFAAVIDKYIGAVPAGETPIRFLGVFDTVASIGTPNLDDEEKPVSDVVFENDRVSPFVEEALHLVSVDENRLAFRPTLMNKEDRVTEIWFPGAHADVGGGFWFDGLSDLALEYMITEFQRRGLGIEVLDPDTVNYENLAVYSNGYRIDYEDVVIKPLLKGKAHPRDRWGPLKKATLAPRQIRVNIADTATTLRPLIHNAVGQRIQKLTDYRPRALKGVVHNQVTETGAVDDGDGGTGYPGLRPYM